MATTSSSAILASFGLVSTSIFSSLTGWIYLIAGVFVAWWAIESIYLLFFSDYPERAKKLRDKGINVDLF
jgi:hypothetical protein